MQTKKNEIWVGIFLLAALLAALFVCLKAANVTSIRTEPNIFTEYYLPWLAKAGICFTF